MNNCLFCKIVRGEEPKHHVWEDERFVAFLTIHPHSAGHLLIIPKHHVSSIYDLDETLYPDIFVVAQRLERVLLKVTQARRIGLVIEGFGVDHGHIHLIPINRERDLDSDKAHTVPEAELRAMAERIRNELAATA